MKIEPLLFCPSPRDIPEFYDSFNKITNYDKYFVWYTKPEVLAYEWGRDIFLEHKQYTHFVICPDDLIIKQEHVDKLISDLEIFDDNHCVGGFCNIDTTEDKKEISNICMDRVNTDQYPNRKYNFMTLQALRDLSVHKKFIEVGFSGFPLFAIPRPILEKIEFRNDSYDGWDDCGCCLDVMFCHDLLENGYKIICDLSLELYHMKIDDNKVAYFYANGEKERKRYFEYKKIKEIK